MSIRVRTTLDVALQIAVEGMVTGEARFLGDHANVSALVINNSDRSILAYVGGSDYFGPAGMVHMVRAVRSPGSTLKPFIYGLAFDLGVLTPDTLVEDRPVRFGDYAPADFDRAFHGAVSVREALQQSYNAPAVQVLNEVGPGRLAATLRLAGVHLKFPHHHWAPALPLALGGVGTTLRDLAMLCAGLADDGQARPLRVLQDSAVVPASPLMTHASARMIAGILRGTPTPDGVAPAVSRAIAYKTGTSYGFRDALALGYSVRYTVGVWVGRTDGTPRTGSYGRNTALHSCSTSLISCRRSHSPRLRLSQTQAEWHAALAPL
jgi:penicillin-binding protein 1C